MSEQPGLMRRAARWATWSVLPVLFAFRPGYRATREAVDVLREAPTVQPVDWLERQTTESPVRADDFRQARARTRRFGRLFGVLLGADVLWWLWVVGHGAALLGPQSVARLAAAMVLGSQFLLYAHANWQARTGRTGSLLDFLEDGRNLWPR